MTRWLPALVLLASCGPGPEPEANGHGPIAPGISGPMGTVISTATEEQKATFERGHAVAIKQFALSDGLGPAFNVTFCGACHEKPVTGGGGGLYRNFFLTARRTEDGAYFVADDPVSPGGAGGVIRLYYYGDLVSARPPVPETTNIIAQRNPIPFFGVGLLAGLEEEEILKRADPFDLDLDGISGRPNYDRGFVGRFGRKAQTVSIEGFIRGPLFNHLGITSDPLTDEQRGRLPVDSRSTARQGAIDFLRDALDGWAQAAAPDGPLTDDDDAPDPELSTDELFDLVSFSMLLAAPELEPLDDQGKRGRKVFDALDCGACHTPRLDAPAGPLPAYTDLLLHDMGPELADGLQMGEALGSEFRTHPLWGIAATGPYLHDGRASTLHEAIAAHGGEAASRRDSYLALAPADQEDLHEFLQSLGGRDQHSSGLLPPGAPIDEVGDYGGPLDTLDADEQTRFLTGRRLFDTEFGRRDGVGGPRMNGDSCRACHFEPTIGGAGPRGVNVVRHGVLSGDQFAVPAVGTILHRTTVLPDTVNRPQPEASIFELRQTPHLYGLGLIDAISEDTILANADPDDLDDDQISGRASWTDGGRLGRFGWKAQVPTVEEFVRDAVTAEMGMTLPYVEGLTFGRIQDNDDVDDPEMSLGEANAITDYLLLLGPPPRQPATDPTAADAGEALFDAVGCTGCHIPELEGADGPVPLYSDLLLHRILPDDALGIEDASADMWEFRTAPLWGVSQTGPWLHSGEADTLAQAIEAHDGEATPVRDAFVGLDPADQQAIVAFLETL